MYKEKNMDHFQNITCLREKIQRVITVSMSISEDVAQFHGNGYAVL